MIFQVTSHDQAHTFMFEYFIARANSIFGVSAEKKLRFQLSKKTSLFVFGHQILL